MAEMTATTRAVDLHAAHAESVVGVLLNRTFLGGLVEAGPAAARFKLRVRGEQLLAAGRAQVLAFRVTISVLAGERALGTLLAQHVVLLGGQFVAPFFFGLLNLLSGLRRV